MAERIKSIEDLELMRAAAAGQNTTIPNYNEWSEILKTLEEAGIQSTGSYSGDKAKLKEIETAVEEFIKEAQIEQLQQKNQQQNNTQEVTKGNEDVDNKTDQTVKANVANSTSSIILADYMKYYHLMS